MIAAGSWLKCAHSWDKRYLFSVFIHLNVEKLFSVNDLLWIDSIQPIDVFLFHPNREARNERQESLY